VRRRRVGVDRALRQLDDVETPPRRILFDDDLRRR
jgi:nitrogen fixation-related uncharacterized protein